MLAVMLMAPASAFAAEPPDPGAALIPCSQAATRVQVTVSSHLDPSCTYTGGIDVLASNVALDCQGALVRSSGSGVGIEVRTTWVVSMTGVTVRNCRVDGFLNSIRVTRANFRPLATAGHEYDHELSDVTIEDSQLSSSRGVGMYVDGYVSDVTLRNLTITGAGSTGIYLEAGSRDNLVQDNVVHDNGFRENGPGGTLFDLGGQTFRFWGIGREGLAIDGSYNNRVVGNSFEGNSAGGIFVYTNCGEFVNQRPERWFQRRFGADDNVIKGNVFTGGINGVWVGSRMGENTYPMDCSDPKYVTGPALAVALDRAADNTVRNNVFNDVTYGVRVEDDGTKVVHNQFNGTNATQHAVVVGTRFRTDALDHPVTNTTIKGNVSSIAGNDFPYRWNHGIEGLTASGNTANGRAVGLCRGKSLPHTALIFVLAAVPLDPDGPPTPPPEGLVMPTVGALPPCGSLVAGTVAAAEGNAGAVTVQVPVTLSAASSDPVTATWATSPVSTPGWASTPADYRAASGSVTFAPGQTTRTVPVTINGDALDEPDEYVLVKLSNPSGAALGGLGVGSVRIVDDDPLPVVVPGSATVVEGDDGVTSLQIPVQLSAPSGRVVTADWVSAGAEAAGWATPPGDFASGSGTVTFAAGQTTATVTVAVNGDRLDEADERFVVALGRSTNAVLGGFYGLGVGVISDDDGS